MPNTDKICCNDKPCQFALGLKTKLRLIDRYLRSENIDRRWEQMILEYRQMLLAQEEDGK